VTYRFGLDAVEETKVPTGGTKASRCCPGVANEGTHEVKEDTLCAPPEVEFLETFV
jgi:hypothetical protein